MKYFTVEQVAEAIGKSPETVRRLLRDSKNTLFAPKPTSSKSGWKIPEDSLRKFLDSTPKYMTKAASELLNPSVSLPFLIGGIVGGVVSFLAINKKKKVTSELIHDYIDQEINLNVKKIERVQRLIDEKMNKISELQLEVEMLSNELDDAVTKASNYRYALDNIDCNELVESINNNLNQ